MHNFIGSSEAAAINVLNLFRIMVLSIVIKLVECVSVIMNITTKDTVVKPLRVGPVPKVGITGKLNHSALMIFTHILAL